MLQTRANATTGLPNAANEKFYASNHNDSQVRKVTSETPGIYQVILVTSFAVLADSVLRWRPGET